MSGGGGGDSTATWLDKKMSREKVSYTLPTAMPNPFGGGGGGPPPPKKYAKSHSKGGLMKLNPEWKQWKDECHQKAQQQAAVIVAASSSSTSTTPVPVTNPAAAAAAAAAVVVLPTTMTTTALPIVTSMADHAEMNEISVANGGKEVPLAESTNATIELFQQPEISHETGLTADTALDAMGTILSKYEVPIGLMNKLLLLSELQVLEFIIDDSGSMLQYSDTVHPMTGRPITRWDEAKVRLLEMMELLAHLPFQTIYIIFLNRKSTTITFSRQGRTPAVLYQDMVQQITSAFATPPVGTTPFLETLQASFQRHQGKSVARWFFGDGMPNGGVSAQEQITSLLQHRPHPEQNPVTFVSCTNEDSEVQWMKDAEEVAPYCSEADDFADEAAEVLRDQGEALPYTKGFHLVCQLVAALCPDDLDAMDESIPLTKPTLDNLLGLQHTEPSYRYYFDAFLAAQTKRTTSTTLSSSSTAAVAVEQWKKQMQWQNSYTEFLTAAIAKEIPAVQKYWAQLKHLEGKAAAAAAAGGTTK